MVKTITFMLEESALSISTWTSTTCTLVLMVFTYSIDKSASPLFSKFSHTPLQQTQADSKVPIEAIMPTQITGIRG